MSGNFSCQSPQLNLNISQNGNNVTGTGSNSCFSAINLTGTEDGNGHLNNVLLTVTVAAQNTGSSGYYGGSYYGGSYYGGSGYGQSSTCTYTGTLNLSNNYLSGTVTLQQNTGYSGGYSSGNCSPSITLNGAMSG
jgi:hypothetical protein